MRFFNTAGPVNCADHYCLPPLERFDLAEILTLIEQKKYFVLHAPRQTGKTSALLALAAHLNRETSFRALYANLEVGQAAREDVAASMRAILNEISSRARDFLDDPFLKEIAQPALRESGPHAVLGEVLTRWAEHSRRPIVLILDEVDALVGDTLISVLRQLRAGYDKRPTHFPSTVMLCGVRDVRDYRIHSSQSQTIITGGSAFNIKAVSLETTFVMRAGRDRSQPITADRIVEAKENLILQRETHLDHLIDKLKEERVRRVVAPMLQGVEMEAAVSEDDLRYVVDLGLIRHTDRGPQVANPIYGEIIPRELTFITQLNLESRTVWGV